MLRVAQRRQKLQQRAQALPPVPLLQRAKREPQIPVRPHLPDEMFSRGYRQMPYNHVIWYSML